MLGFFKGLLAVLAAVFFFVYLPPMISSNVGWVFNLGWLIIIGYAAVLYWLFFVWKNNPIVKAFKELFE